MSQDRQTTVTEALRGVPELALTVRPAPDRVPERLVLVAPGAKPEGWQPSLLERMVPIQRKVTQARQAMQTEPTPADWWRVWAEHQAGIAAHSAPGAMQPWALECLRDAAWTCATKALGLPEPVWQWSHR